MRRFAIGVTVLGVLVALYVVYARIGGTPSPGLSVPEPLPVPTADAAKEPNSRGGRIGPMDTEVIDIEKTRFFHRDESGRVDREFGFEVFLHKQADRWRFTHPYMTLFLPKLQCHVIADTGEVQVQSAFGQLVPNDALFQGNVVIHIAPPKRDDPRECLIYLDDVTFVAEQSLFSSTGPVRFESRSAVLEGVGMELIYDSLQGRLELFRVVKLTSLRIRSADIALFSGDKDVAGRERHGTGEPTAVAPQQRTGSASASAAAGVGRVLYECVLRGNATIDTPERIVIARDLLSIVDVPWPRSAQDESAADRKQTEPSEPNASEPVPEPLDTERPGQIAFHAPPAESFDIVVTCSGGLVVAPMGTWGRHVDPNDLTRYTEGIPPALDAQSNRQQAIAQRIEYNATTGDAAFIGPVQMAAPIDSNSLAGPAQAQANAGRTLAGRGESIPMTITAREAVRYISALDRVLFEGDCMATAVKTDPNVTHEFALSAPTFALDLVEDVNAMPSGKAIGKAVTLKRFWTDGGPASIVVKRRAGRLHSAGEGKLLGSTQVLASQLEYEAASKLFTARGPDGELRLNNAQGSSLDPNVVELRASRTPSRTAGDKPRQVDPNAFGFNEPCYAFLQGFDLLTFASDTNRIVVASESQPILIDYIAMTNGRPGRHIRGSAGNLDLTLLQTAPGRMELGSLIAAKGITYEDQDKQFAGGTLTYDRERSLVKVVGDDTQPCSLNGAPVDGIEMDVTTGTLKTRLEGPGVFQGKR